MKLGYRIFINNSENPTAVVDLERILSITVVQELDAVWEAKVLLPVCLDGKGSWQSHQDDFSTQMRRLRIEVTFDDIFFTPLIDGDVVGYDSNLSGEPGGSTVAWVIQDNLHLLQFDKGPSKSMANYYELFKAEFEAAGLLVDDANLDAELKKMKMEEETLKGPIIQKLREVGETKNFHFYVKPTEVAGNKKNKILFKPLDLYRKSSLPALVLFGEGRNMQEFEIKEDRKAPGEVKNSSLSFGSKSASTFSVRLDTLGSGAPTTSTKELFQLKELEYLPTYSSTFAQVEEAVEGKAKEKTFVIEATGSLDGRCYQEVLSPDEIVEVAAGDAPFSGRYMVKAVTHTLTRHGYTQDFSLVRNEVSGIVAIQAIQNFGKPS